MVSVTIDRRDGLNSAAAIKGPCRVATTANITLTGLQTVDGVALAEGDRVLVKNQTDARDNGIRIASTGNWERSADFRNSRDIVTGTQVYITHGTVSAERWYGVTAANPISVGTTNLTFAVADVLSQVEAIAAAFPAVAANTMLVDNAAGTARETKTFAQIADLLPVLETGSSATAVDFNTLTDPGFYGLVASTNAPTTLYTGEWLVTIAESTTTGNVWQIAAPSLNPQAQWSRRRISGIWSAWAPVGGKVTLEHYGATGTFNSGTNDAAFLQAALQSGFGAVLVGTYNLGSLVQCGSGFGDKDVFLEGSAKEHLRVTAAGGGIKFNTGVTTSQTGLRCVFRDFNMLCDVASHTVVALEVAGVSGSGTGTTIKNFEISNIQLFATDDTKGFATGISIDNGRNGTIRGCTYQGVRNQTVGARAGIGFEVRGNADPVDILIDDCEAYFCVRGFSVTGTAEGTRLTNSTAVACDNGGYFALDENPISGTNTGKQLVQVDNCHFNCFYYGLYINRVWDVMVQNTSILFEAANSNAQGIFLGMEGDIQLRARIDCCSIMDRTTGAPGVGSTLGINVQNTNVALGTMVRITNTIFDSLDAGIWAQANTNDIKYDQNSCIFTNCGAATGGNVAGITAY